MTVANEFDIEFQFRKYLELVGLNIHTMPPYQRREMRRAFYGAWGMLLVVMRDNISEMPENDALDVFEAMQEQIEAFWTNQVSG